MTSKQIIESFQNRDEFLKLLGVNPGLVIVKLGATWCGPCKAIATVVHAFFASSPANVVCADIDVDESFDLYAVFKQKKMVNGIPVIMVFKRGNISFIPDDSVTGSGAPELDAFFKRCNAHLKTVS